MLHLNGKVSSDTLEYACMLLTSVGHDKNIRLAANDIFVFLSPMLNNVGISHF